MLSCVLTFSNFPAPVREYDCRNRSASELESGAEYHTTIAALELGCRDDDLRILRCSRSVEGVHRQAVGWQLADSRAKPRHGAMVTENLTFENRLISNPYTLALLRVLLSHDRFSRATSEIGNSKLYDISTSDC